MLSALSVGDLSVLIIIVLNSQSGNSNIPTISEFGSDAYFISSNCVFCLMSSNFLFLLLKAGHDVLNKRIFGKEAISGMVVR